MAKKTVKLSTRHWDSTFQLMSWWDPETVQNAKIMVVGAGALGNEVLKNLALMNVGNILIVDFDTIEYSNLCRSVLFRGSDVKQHKLKSEVAAQRIQEINPNIKVMTISGDIGIDVGLGVFRNMDVIIGCLDNRLARLYINRLCFKVGKTWIDGAIENLAGQLNVYQSGVACYECQLHESERINIRAKMGCPDIARRYSAQGRIPTTPISSSIIGAMQVQEALKIIHGNEKASMAGESFYYEGMTNTVIQSKAPPLQEDCLSHFGYKNEDIVEAEELSHTSSLKEVFEFLREKFEDEHPVIELDHELVLELTGEESGISHSLMYAKPHLSDKLTRSYLKTNENVRITESLQKIDGTFPKLQASLKDIGIPPFHMLNVWAKGDTHLVELSGDKKYLNFA